VGLLLDGVGNGRCVTLLGRFKDGFSSLGSLLKFEFAGDSMGFILFCSTFCMGLETLFWVLICNEEGLLIEELVGKSVLDEVCVTGRFTNFEAEIP